MTVRETIRFLEWIENRFCEEYFRYEMMDNGWGFVPQAVDDSVANILNNFYSANISFVEKQNTKAWAIVDQNGKIVVNEVKRLSIYARKKCARFGRRF